MASYRLCESTCVSNCCVLIFNISKSASSKIVLNNFCLSVAHHGHSAEQLQLICWLDNFECSGMCSLYLVLFIALNNDFFIHNSSYDSTAVYLLETLQMIRFLLWSLPLQFTYREKTLLSLYVLMNKYIQAYDFMDCSYICFFFHFSVAIDKPCEQLKRVLFRDKHFFYSARAFLCLCFCVVNFAKKKNLSWVLPVGE